MMTWWVQAVLVGVCALSSVVLLVTLFLTGRPVRACLGSTLQGACALAAVNVTGALTGVSLGLNWFSAVACVSLGVPGVIGLLLLRLIVEL